jgi:hypothetical protein
MPREPFVLPVKLLDELRVCAEAEGVTLSEVVGRLLREHLPGMLAELLVNRMVGGWRDCPPADSEAPWYWASPPRDTDATPIDVRSGVVDEGRR